MIALAAPVELRETQSGPRIAYLACIQSRNVAEILVYPIVAQVLKPTVFFQISEIFQNIISSCLRKRLWHEDCELVSWLRRIGEAAN
jgi:hypothetical protein